MQDTYKVLIFGASYGSLLGAKLAIAGHKVTLVCLPAEVDIFNREGAIIRTPVKGREGLVEFTTRKQFGRLSAVGPREARPADYDLVVLAMQEPQYSSSGVRELLKTVATARVPCMSIMNMPPLAYLKRLPGIDVDACRSCYTDASVWDAFDPALVTLCSPDPQAFRPAGEKLNVLQVRLPTNFKAAAFPSNEHTAILRKLETDIDAIRYDIQDGVTELPVKLRLHESPYVPLAKWSMLLAGNYRCVQQDRARSIKDAVHANIDETRHVYQWVADLCVALGATERDLVPFEKYANAALSLTTPSSAARALFSGAHNIERVDRLVQTIATQYQMRSSDVDEIVSLVDARLEINRRQGDADRAGRAARAG
jgi:hypothetical protein